jgi:HEAT repeat protein
MIQSTKRAFALSIPVLAGLALNLGACAQDTTAHEPDPANRTVFVDAPQQDIQIPGLTERGKRELAKRPIPDLTAEGQPDKTHDWNLGPTGARGWMWGMLLRTDCARQILITKVEPGSPADGVLEVGDVILGIGKQYFGSDARIAFGRAITQAEKAQNRGELKLLRWRDGQTQTVTLQLKVMGSYGRRAPMDCPKSKLILDDALAYIARNGIGKGIPGYVNAMGLLASGDEKYLPLVRDFAHQVKVEDARGMSSWNMSYLNIFLCEYHLLTGDPAALPKIREASLYLANGQSPVGTWGHGNVLPTGVLGGYGAMCLPTLSCAVSLQLSQKCGIDDPVVAKAIRRSEIFFSSFVDKGNIPYGDHSPRDVHDSNGRCSLAAIFFDLQDNPRSFEFFARMTIASYGEREEGHTGNYWSFLWGPLGARRAGPQAAAAFIKELEWFFDLERRWDGGFTYQGGANMTGSEHTTPGWDTTGARALMYAMAKGKLYITGKGSNAAKALTGRKLEDTLFAGRGYSVWIKHGLVDKDPLDDLTADKLLEHLVTWSTPLRIRVAKALSRKQGDHVPALMKMLQSQDRQTILGGVYGLEHQRRKAEPAVDQLVSLLSHEDVWIRFRAGAALCAIGKPAREKAVPVLLKNALWTSADDPREMHQRYTSFVLWGGGANGAPHGLIAGDMTGVDAALLVRALKKLMRNTDGHTRSFAARGLKLMTAQQLKPLWDDMIWAVEHPAPSGIMFNAVIRETGLDILVKHRFKEAIPLLAQYARDMKQHGSQDRIYRVMDALAGYGAAAKSQLPSLYETRKYYEKNLGPNKPLPFPTWAYDKFMKGLNEGIAKIESATQRPTDLRSLEDFR